MMEKLFVPFEIAVMAKEKGFDEPCLSCYTPRFKQGEISLVIMEEKNQPYVLKHRGTFPSGVEIYEDVVLAPLYQQVVDWLWDKQGIVITI